MIRIGIDGRALTRKPAGVSNFLIMALNNLPRFIPGFHFIVFAHKPLSPEAVQKLKNFKNVEYIIDSRSLINRISMIWFQLKLPFKIKKYNLTYFWGPGQTIPFFISGRIKKILTICDVVFIKYKNTMSLPTFFESLIWTGRNIKKSDLIWTISDYTKNEIEKAFPRRKCSEIFVGLDIDHGFFRKIKIPNKEKKLLLEKYKISYPFILFVGTVEPRKNLSFLLSLMPELSKPGINLLVVGVKGWKQEKSLLNIINSQGFPKNKIYFSGYLPTDDLVKLYNTANLYVSTSINEGFGLPALEAAACGCPVICPDNSGMSEINNEMVTKILGWDKQVWINKILQKVKSGRPSGIMNPVPDKWETISIKFKEYLCGY